MTREGLRHAIKKMDPKTKKELLDYANILKEELKKKI